MAKPIHSQTGAALLIVLLLVASMAVTSLALTRTMRILISQSGAAAARDNAAWALLGAEQAALLLLSAQNSFREDIDTPDESWLKEAIVLPVEGGVVQGRFVDRSACFNLNHLISGNTSGSLVANPNSVRRFSQYLEEMGGDRRSGEMLGNSIADFLDGDDKIEPGGAEDYIYTDSDLPYVTSRTFLSEVSEVRAIRNWTAPIYRGLVGKLCVREENDSFGLLNINTLTIEDAPLLYAAFDGRVSIRSLEQLISDRPADGYDNVTAFTARQQFQLLDPPLTPESLGRFSTYASLIEFSAEVFYGDVSFKMTSLIEGQAGGQYRVVSRRLGALDL